MKGEWIEKGILRGRSKKRGESIKIRESGSKEREERERDQSKAYNKKEKEKSINSYKNKEQILISKR